jgi:branched-chain amino acid transport system permease protein
MGLDLKKIYNGSTKGSLLVAVILLGLPLVFSTNNYLLSTLIMIGFYTIVSTGLTLLMGYAGQISLGQAAFYGIGAYTSAYFTTHFGLSPWLAMIVGAILAAMVAFVIGIPAFRLREHYLALATLGFGVIVFTFFKEWKEITGGLNGFFGIPPISLFGITIQTDFQFYYLVWVFALIGILFARNIVQSRIGRALLSIHGSEIAANSLGVNITKYKLQMFMISAIYAAVAGSLYAHYVTFINPQLFEMITSIYFLIMVVIGGAGSVWGGLIGAAVYVCLGELLKEIVPLFIPNAGGEFEIVFFGILLVIMLIYMPNGLSHSVPKIVKRLLPAWHRKNESMLVSENENASSIGGERL